MSREYYIRAGIHVITYIKNPNMGNLKAKSLGERKPTHLTSANICINICNIRINAFTVVP
jgi:hypothetical protein